MEILKEELTVDYKSELRWAGIMFLILGIILGSGAFLFAYLYYARSSALGLLSRGIILALISVTCLYVASLANQRKLVLSSHGILFPVSFAFDTLFRLERNWPDLGAVSLEKESIERDQQALWLTFHFRSKGKARLRFKNLSVDGLDAIFSACKKWGSTSVISPELIEIRRKLSADERSLESKAIELLTTTKALSPTNETQRIHAAVDSSLAFKYFMSYGSYGPQGFNETVLPYEPEQELNLKVRAFLNRFPHFQFPIFVLCLSVIILTASPYPLLLILFCFSLLPLGIGIYAAAQPTHIALSRTGLKFYWIHWFGDKSHELLKWQNIRQVAVSDDNNWLLFKQNPEETIFKLRLCSIRTRDEKERLLSALKTFIPENVLSSSVQNVLSAESPIIDPKR